MSKKQKEAIEAAVPSVEGAETSESSSSRRRLFTYLKAHLWVTAAIALVALGAIGAGLKYLDEDAKRELAKNSNDRSFISSVNPFMPTPTPAPTPQLLKEYIYAGSRLLAVEDANASAIPPADLAIWRPSNGLWCVLGGPGSAQTIYGWGTTGDLPAPGDYDGDGKTDFAVYRRSATQWYILKSSDGTYYAVTQGWNETETPAPGDYDGDGKTDTALFRPLNSNWYIVKSSDSSGYNFQWGTTNDKTAQADFDGDGKTDAAVWRGSDTNFYILKSSDGNWTYGTVGSSASDTPVPGDYTGDGKADMAVLNGTNWIIKDSATGTLGSPISWGASGDIPVQNDYDGDGKVDIASWRGSTGYWYIRNSHDLSTRSVAWGMSGDIPVPALYRR